jgi:mRNA-degrading endonuclease toxin of MazEF toxin-antitoxin module
MLRVGIARANADTAAVVAADDHAKGKGGRREPVTIVVAVAMALVAIAAMAVVITALVVAVKTAPLVVVPVTEIAAVPVAVLNLDQTGRACNLDCRFLCNNWRRARWSEVLPGKTRPSRWFSSNY